MRRTIVCTIIFTVVLVSTAVCGETKLGIRAHGGYGTVAMSDINNGIEQFNSLLAQNGMPSSFDKISGGIVFGADLLVYISPTVSVIVSYDRATSSVDNRITAFDGLMRQDLSVSGDFFSGGVLVFPQPGTPIYIVAKAGYGSGQAKLDLDVVVTPPSQPFELSNGYDADGSSFIVETGLGGQLDFSLETPIFGFAELTYRYRNLGTFEGTGYVNEDSGIGTITDGIGNEIDFDYSGISVKVGIGLNF